MRRRKVCTLELTVRSVTVLQVTVDPELTTAFGIVTQAQRDFEEDEDLTRDGQGQHPAVLSCKKIVYDDSTKISWCALIRTPNLYIRNQLFGSINMACRLASCSSEVQT